MVSSGELASFRAKTSAEQEEEHLARQAILRAQQEMARRRKTAQEPQRQGSKQQPRKATAAIQDLPDEILLRIFLELKPADLCACALVCKRFK
jgi:hypothetical protein